MASTSYEAPRPTRSAGLTQVRSGKVPRPYQVEGLNRMQKALTTRVGKALIVLATGLGKTFLLILFMKWLFLFLKKRPRVLVLCDQNFILDQLRDDFIEELGDEDYSYGMLNGEEEPPDGDVDFLFASFQTMAKYLTVFPSEYFYAIFVDEAHHAAAKHYRKVLEHFSPKYIGGLTATPVRRDGKDITQIFGQPLIYLPLVKALALKLTPRIDYKIFLDTPRSSKSIPIRDLESLSMADLDRYLFARKPTRKQMIRVVERIIEEMEEIRKTEPPKVIIYCPSTAMVDRIDELLNERGICSAAIHSQIDDDGQELLREFKLYDYLEVIVVVNQVNEGVDVPRVNLVAMLRATKSLTIFEQQLGRGLRGRGVLRVMDFVGNAKRLAFLGALFAKLREVVADLAELDGLPDFSYDESLYQMYESRDPNFNPYSLLLEAAGLGNVDSDEEEEDDDEPVIGIDVEDIDEDEGSLNDDVDYPEDWPEQLPITITFESEFKGVEIEFLRLMARVYQKAKVRQWTEEEIIAVCKDWAGKNGRSNLNDRDVKLARKQLGDEFPTWKTLLDFFGDTSRAINEAIFGFYDGAIRRTGTIRWTRDEVIKVVRAWADGCGKTQIAKADIEQAREELGGDIPCWATIEKLLGYGKKAINEAIFGVYHGVVKSKGKNWSKDAAIKVCRKWAKSHRKTYLEHKDFIAAKNELGDEFPGLKTLGRLFGYGVDNINRGIGPL